MRPIHIPQLMLALLLCPVWAGAAGYEMHSYITQGGQTQALLAWCDAPQAVLALTAPSKSMSDLWMWNKNGSTQPVLSRVNVGQPDPGAGQIYQSLKVTTGPHAGQNGFLHTSNIENVQDPAYRMTKTGEFKLGNQTFRCRYVPQAAFVGVTNKRTVIIWESGTAATYATRNFDGSVGVYVTGGRKRYTTEGGTGYEFNTADGYTYGVMIDEYRPASGAKLSVYKGGNLKLSENFGAYSVSVARPGQ